MVTCPRCEQPVDETVRTTCPLCFTPITPPAPAVQPPAMPSGGVGLNAPSPGYAAPQQPQGLAGMNDAQPPTVAIPGMYPQQSPQPPQPQPTYPAAPPPAMNPGARVSLTGEVIDPGVPSGPPPSYVGGGAPVPPGPRPTGPVAPRPAGMAGRMPVAEAPAKSGGGAVAAVVVVVVLLLAGVGGWYLMMHRTNPKDQALTLYKGILSQDWNTVYPLIAFNESDRKKYPDAQSFASETQKQIDSNPLAAQVIGQLKNAASTATVGEPVITGDKADVPTSVKMSSPIGELTFKGTAHMVNQAGIWKFDLTSNNQGDILKANQDLIGKPEGMGGLGGGLGLPKK